MPLKAGKSKKVIEKNINELARSLISKGASPKKAFSRATAAARRKAGLPLRSKKS